MGYVFQVWADTYIPDSGLGCEGEVRLMPDVESQVVCPWHPLHELVLADFQESPGGLSFLLAHTKARSQQKCEPFFRSMHA